MVVINSLTILGAESRDNPKDIISGSRATWNHQETMNRLEMRMIGTEEIKAHMTDESKLPNLYQNPF